MCVLLAYVVVVVVAVVVAVVVGVADAAVVVDRARFDGSHPSSSDCYNPFLNPTRTPDRVSTELILLLLS